MSPITVFAVILAVSLLLRLVVPVTVRLATIVNVRDNPASADAQGWYKHPSGTVAGKADAARMIADVISDKG